MEKLLSRLKKSFPAVNFEQGDAFSWSPGKTTVTYCLDGDETAGWTLLHEVAHVLLGHSTYKYDIELLLLEVAAWEKAKELAAELSFQIDENYIQDSLDTYRDWLYQRSTCPRCSTVSLQASAQDYRCYNCNAIWHVSASRFCRPYRLSIKPNKKSLEISQATFSSAV